MKLDINFDIILDVNRYISICNEIKKSCYVEDILNVHGFVEYMNKNITWNHYKVELKIDYSNHVDYEYMFVVSVVSTKWGETHDCEIYINQDNSLKGTSVYPRFTEIIKKDTSVAKELVKRYNKHLKLVNREKILKSIKNGF